MPKPTPGTHVDDDKSQQPRQVDTPKKRDSHMIDKEDHMNAREKLATESSDREDDSVSKRGSAR